MTDPTDRSGPQWNTSPSAKLRTAVQRSVTALLDELAPERVLRRVEQLEGMVEQHRTPTGCVLQAATCAVSVSWFPEDSQESALGELHVLVWQGKVTRRGASGAPKKATLVTELRLLPLEPPVDDCVWESSDGARYDTLSLAAKCLALLEAQVAAKR